MEQIQYWLSLAGGLIGGIVLLLFLFFSIKYFLTDNYTGNRDGLNIPKQLLNFFTVVYTVFILFSSFYSAVSFASGYYSETKRVLVNVFFFVINILLAFFANKLYLLTKNLSKSLSFSNILGNILSVLSVFYVLITSIYLIDEIAESKIFSFGKHRDKDIPTDSISIAHMAFHVPPKMKVGKVYEAVFYITKSNNKNVLVYKFSKDDLEKYVFVDSLYLSPSVSVSLVDAGIDNENFKIERKGGSAIQNVNQKNRTIWQFSVKPLKGGKNELLVIVSGFINSVPKDSEFEAYRRIIDVESDYAYSTTDTFERNWTTIVPYIIIPLILFFLGVWYAKKTPEQKPIEVNVIIDPKEILSDEKKRKAEANKADTQKKKQEKARQKIEQEKIDLENKLKEKIAEEIKQRDDIIRKTGFFSDPNEDKPGDDKSSNT